MSLHLTEAIAGLKLDGMLAGQWLTNHVAAPHTTHCWNQAWRRVLVDTACVSWLTGQWVTSLHLTQRTAGFLA